MEEPPADKPPVEEPPVEEPSVEPPAEVSPVEYAAPLAQAVSEAGTEPETASALSDASDTPVEPEMVEVWRLAPLYPRREQRKPRTSAPPRRERPADGEKRFQQVAKPRPGGGGGKRDHRRPERDGVRADAPRPDRAARPPPRPRDRPVDPDNPFAALQALKKELEKNRGE